MSHISAVLAEELQVNAQYVDNVIALLDEGNTIPFIARYRKEQHGSLDDQQLRDISDRLNALRNIEQRRNEISESLKKLEVWTEELQAALDNAATLAQLEDVYRPYRPKRRTRASIAKERGLEPLANVLMMQPPRMAAPEEMAAKYDHAKLTDGFNTVDGEEIFYISNPALGLWVCDD